MTDASGSDCAQVHLGPTWRAQGHCVTLSLFRYLGNSIFGSNFSVFAQEFILRPLQGLPLS
jgi:hypothetical protein